MNCAVCMAFLQNWCVGCWSPDRKCHKNCSIRSCPDMKGKYCFTCPTFPCRRVRQLDARYRKKYGMSMLENLEMIKREGIRKFIRSEKERWVCTKCGGTINVHRYCCSKCGGRVPPRRYD